MFSLRLIWLLAKSKILIINSLYLIDFKMHRDGKGVNPREHTNYVTGVSAANKEAT